jgi:prepilin-type processing-associated H-X9-DG protein
MGWRNRPENKQWLMADRLVSTDPKAPQAQLFSADGKPPGNNHHKHGGVILFADGSAEIVGKKSAGEMTRPSGTTILNPRP